jgi:hypothetical protein
MAMNYDIIKFIYPPIYYVPQCPVDFFALNTCCFVRGRVHQWIHRLQGVGSNMGCNLQDVANSVSARTRLNHSDELWCPAMVVE